MMPSSEMASYERKIQLQGWNKKDFKEIRNLVTRLWKKEELSANLITMADETPVETPVEATPAE